MLEQYTAKAEHYLCACLGLNNGSNVDRSPGGMLYVRQWNNLQYASSAAFLLTVYSHYLAGAGASLRSRLRGYGRNMTYQGSDTFGYGDTAGHAGIRPGYVSDDFPFSKKRK